MCGFKMNDIDHICQLHPELIHLILGYYHTPQIKLIITQCPSVLPKFELQLSHVNQLIHIQFYSFLYWITKQYNIHQDRYDELSLLINAMCDNQMINLYIGAGFVINHDKIKIYDNRIQLDFPNTQEVRHQFVRALQELYDIIPTFVKPFDI